LCAWYSSNPVILVYAITFITTAQRAKERESSKVFGPSS